MNESDENMTAYVRYRVRKSSSVKSHSGVIGQFSEQIVRPGIVSIDEFRVYAKLLNWRSKGDYNDLFDFSREDVDSMMEPTKHFIDKVASLIELE